MQGNLLLCCWHMQPEAGHGHCPNHGVPTFHISTRDLLGPLLQGGWLFRYFRLQALRGKPPLWPGEKK